MVSLPARSQVEALAQDIVGGQTDVARQLQAAFEDWDPDAALALVLACRAAGRCAPASAVARLIPHISNPLVLPLVVGACDGDRSTMLLDAVEASRMGAEVDAVAVFLAHHLAEGDPPPRLASLVRAVGRNRLGVEASILIALLARRLGDPNVTAVVEPWISMADTPDAPRVEEWVLGLLNGPVLDNLPEGTRREIASGFTFKRPTPKVGRNEPCPCGSGKKYKKCCGSASDSTAIAKVSRVDRSDALRAASPAISPSQVRSLPVSDLPRLDPTSMPTLAVIALFQMASLRRQWKTAQTALDALAKRTDLPKGCVIDEYRADLINEAMEAGAEDVVDTQVAALKDPTVMSDVDRFALALLRGEADLQTLESIARVVLEEPDGSKLIDLAFTVLDHRPALGILFARAALSPDRSLDSHMLLNVVEEARDRLGLPPSDPAWETWEQTIGEGLRRKRAEPKNPAGDAPRNDLIERAERTREDLERASRKIGELERQLAEQTEPKTGPATEPKTIIVEVPSLTTASPEVSAALRTKVRELKGLIAESNEERMRLRRELAELAGQLERERGASRSRKAEARQEPPEDAEAGVEPPRDVLVPSFDKRAADAIAGLPRDVARDALALVASLAGGDEASWKRTKKLELAEPPMLSARVGLHYRLLFTAGDGRLCAREIIHRRELEKTLRRHG